MRSRKPLVMLFALLILATAGCSKPRDTGFPPPPPSPTGSETTKEFTGVIDVVDSAFDPTEVEWQVDTKLTWTQTGSAPHTVTSATGSAIKFDSNPDCAGAQLTKCLGKGDSFSFTFAKAGTYLYYCKIHGASDGKTGMVGTIVVK